MRPLKRPMFRTGGPIKEGVMNGLREGGVATTMADATMMAGGGMAMPDMRGRVTGPGGYAGKKKAGFKLTDLINPLKLVSTPTYVGIDQAIAALTPYSGLFANGGIASLPKKAALVGNPVYPKTNGREHHKNVMSFFGAGTKGSAAAKPGLIRSGLANIYGRAKKFLPTFRKQPGQVTGGDIGTRQKYMTQTMPKVPFMEKAGAFVRENPYITGIGLPFGISAGLNVGKGVADTAPGIIESVAKQAADLAIPDFIFDQDKYFAEKEANKKLLEEAKKKQNKGRDLNIQQSGGTKQKDPTKEELDKQKLDRIYKLLGVKKAQANAASKALIDMSRYIDEGGKDVISKENIGSTISKAIGAFDKRLDKADQLKEAAGLMVAKGIANEGDLTRKVQQAKLEQINRELNPTVLDQKLALDLKGQTLTHDRTKTIAKRTFPDAIVLADASDAKDAGVGDTITAEDFVKKQIQTQGGDVAGVYIVDKSVIQVDAKGNTKQIL